MSELVDPDEIEQIVGAPRHRTRHMGRAVSAVQTVYILHSVECREGTPDLRDCQFSIALDRGIDVECWRQDTPVRLAIAGGRLVDAARYIEVAAARSRSRGAR